MSGFVLPAHAHRLTVSTIALSNRFQARVADAVGELLAQTRESRGLHPHILAPARTRFGTA
jgi:hypothetical protein